MDLKWDLDRLFVNQEEFYNEFERVRLLLKELFEIDVIFCDDRVLFDVLDKMFVIKDKSNDILVYGSLMYYKDVNSSLCIKLKDDAERFNNEINSDLKKVENKILDLGRDKIFDFVKENKKLEIYSQYLDDLFRCREHIFSNDKICDNNNFINELIGKYNMYIRDIFNYDIETNDNVINVNFSNYMKMLSSSDRDVRKNAYLEGHKKIGDSINVFIDIILEIVKYRNKNCLIEKYDSVIDKSLFSINIKSNVVDILINSVNDKLYLVHKYFKIKSDIIGIRDYHIYDFNVSICNDLDIKYSIDDAINIVRNSLMVLGSKYIKVVDYLFDNGYVDLYPDNKRHQSITFSWKCYLFMNYRGTYSDLKNLIHEVGHIVNYYLSMNNLPYVYCDSNIFIGEVCAIVNELLLNKYLYEHARSDKEKMFYLSKNIDNYINTLFKQTMYTELENYMYFGGNDICSKYFELIKKYYGNDICYDRECMYELVRVGHLYRHSYYPYKYALGLLVASLIVNSLVIDKSLSYDNYLEFLSLGSSMYSYDLLKVVNVDFESANIFKNGFNILENDIELLKSYSSVLE